MNNFNFKKCNVTLNVNQGYCEEDISHKQDTHLTLEPYGSSFVVEPHSSIEVRKINTPIIPERHSRYYIENSGFAEEIKAVFYWSHAFTSEWFKYSEKKVSIGESATLSAPDNSLYFSKVVIYNNTDTRAFITGRSV